ncbi:MAG: TrkA family potassium uptake protein [Oscillospiraceae bacterium]|jgi:trk system potassium uptake protein TrkA|nr:TrkA family potassium uptake protein [Oscillospiraceae bacterium]
MPGTKQSNRSKKRGSGRDFTIVIGCGRLGAHIAALLSEEGKGVVVIDASREAFLKLGPSFDGISLTGDATELAVLEEANIENASAVIAVTGRDNTNIMVAQMARELYEVPHVIARLYEQERECVYQELGIGTISPVLLSTKEIEHILNPASSGKSEIHSEDNTEAKE